MAATSPHDPATWVGRRDEASDVVSERHVDLLCATLNRDAGVDRKDGILPPLWHWLFFAPQVKTNETGVDGHPRRGEFLPDFGLPNRMWAGGRLQFIRDLALGETIRRLSTIVACERKEGKSGPLGFVVVRHQIFGEDGLALIEEQDIVYRHPPKRPGSARHDKPPGEALFRQAMRAEPLLLFRYSALTFNGHRIHYDRDYAVDCEGYPGLVVHGPLLATLLANIREHVVGQRKLATFAFRAQKPVVSGEEFALCARRAPNDSLELWVDCGGEVAMRAEARLRPLAND